LNHKRRDHAEGVVHNKAQGTLVRERTLGCEIV
jgi:hypothetical protein